MPQMLDHKRCPRCREAKAIAEFHKNKSEADGLQSVCKTCSKLYKADWKARQPKHVKEVQRKSRNKHYVEGVIRRARHRAKQLGVPFNLVEGDLVYPENCPILGIKLTYFIGKRSRDDAPSLDRVVPAKGYIKGNVQIISARANRIKNDATVEELRKIAEYMGAIWS